MPELEERTVTLRVSTETAALWDALQGGAAAFAQADGETGKEGGGPMTGRVPVEAISRQRLRTWVQSCERDHATPLVLLAVGQDERRGTLHVYRTEDGPTDGAVAALLRAAAEGLEQGGAV